MIICQECPTGPKLVFATKKISKNEKEKTKMQYVYRTRTNEPKCDYVKPETRLRRLAIEKKTLNDHISNLRENETTCHSVREKIKAEVPKRQTSPGRPCEIV